MKKQCPKCDKMFARQQTLTRHLEEKDVPCDFKCRYCRKKAKSLSEFKEHMNLKHPAKLELALTKAHNPDSADTNVAKALNHVDVDVNRKMEDSFGLIDIRALNARADVFARSFSDDILFDWIDFVFDAKTNVNLKFLRIVNGHPSKFIRADMVNKKIWVKRGAEWEEEGFIVRSNVVKDFCIASIRLFAKEILRRMSTGRTKTGEALFIVKGTKAKTVSSHATYGFINVSETDVKKIEPCNDEEGDRDRITRDMNKCVMDKIAELEKARFGTKFVLDVLYESK